MKYFFVWAQLRVSSPFSKRRCTVGDFLLIEEGDDVLLDWTKAHSCVPPLWGAAQVHIVPMFLMDFGGPKV